MNVLQGITGQAGQPYAISRGLRKIGIDSDAVVTKEHKFKYSYDRFIDISNVRSMRDMTPVFAEIADYDVLHFHARSFLYSPHVHCYPSALDLLQLRMMGKKIVFHFRGSEIRNRRLFKEKNPYHYAENEAASTLFDRISDEGKEALLPFIHAVAHQVFVVDPELQTYAPDATVVERALDEDEWPFVGLSAGDEPLVVHAPSRRGVKGTEHVLEAVEELKSEGLHFRFELVEGKSIQEAREIYRRADIVVDQLRIGWYGVLAVECMALGKVVISYIRDDLMKEGEHREALLCANPGTIKDTLRKAIKSRELRSEMSGKARRYFERVHASRAVAGKLSPLYQDCFSDRHRLDEKAVSNFLDYQAEALLSSSPASQKDKKHPKMPMADHIVSLNDMSRVARAAVKIDRLMRQQGAAGVCRAAGRRLATLYRTV